MTEDIKLSNDDIKCVNIENVNFSTDLCCSNFDDLLNRNTSSTSSFNHIFQVSNLNEIGPKVSERLKFSNYLIDPNKFRFRKIVRIMAIVIKFSKNWLSKIGKKLIKYSCNDFEQIKTVSNALGFPDAYIILSDDDINFSLRYLFVIATSEVKQFMDSKLYINVTFEKNDILFYSGRVLDGSISFSGHMTDVMYDLTRHSFVVPVVDRFSPLAFSIVNEMHWHDKQVKHSGVETTLRAVMKIAHIFKVRELVKQFRKNCIRCRYLLKCSLDVEMAPISKHQLSVAPAYYVTQVDLCGPFQAYSKHNVRTTLKIWIIVFVCATTGSVNLKVIEGYDTTNFLLGFSRFSCECGFPKLILPDEGGQLLRGSQNMVLKMVDLKGKLNREYGIDFRTCPVSGHNFHGKVERKIRGVRESLEKSFVNSRLSVLEWETLVSEIANSMNNMPIAIGNIVDGLENIDLITPNRLRLGRNNERSPIGSIEIDDKIDHILRRNNNIFEKWWECWLTSVLPKLMAKPKWYKNDENLKVGDVVLFQKTESSLSGDYTIGMVDSVDYGIDFKIRSVVIKYRNFSENIDRFTKRAVRSLTVIHRVDELNIMEEIGKASLIIK